MNNQQESLGYNSEEPLYEEVKAIESKPRSLLKVSTISDKEKEIKEARKPHE